MSCSISDWEAFKRFLILGSESSCYQTSATIKSLTCACIERLVYQNQGQRMIDEIIEVSQQGRSVKQTYLLYALAKVASMSHEHKCYIFKEVLHIVCRTFSTLTEFLSFFENISWGSNTKQGIANWMHTFTPKALAYQLTKYRNRNGYTPRDILRLAHITPKTDEYNDLYKYITGRWDVSINLCELHDFIYYADKIRHTTCVNDVVDCLDKHAFTWEHIGHQALLKNVLVWNKILMNGMPYQALLRNLSRMLKMEYIRDDIICSSLTNIAMIKSQRVHPLHILQAYRMLDNTEVLDKHQSIKDSLDKAYHESFVNVEKIGKRFLLAVDVSGSMDCTPCVGMRCLSARDAVAALCMSIVKKEPFVHVVAFSDHLTKLPMHDEMSLSDVISMMRKLAFSATDCSLPIQYAIDNKLCVDCFVVMTDNETNANQEDPHIVLQRYREQVNENAKMIVLATSANNVSIAHPNDRGMLDIAGMDSSVFHVMKEFFSD